MQTDTPHFGLRTITPPDANYRKQPKTNFFPIPKTIKTTENDSKLVNLDAGMHRKVPKYTEIDKIRRNMHS